MSNFLSQYRPISIAYHFLLLLLFTSASDASDAVRHVVALDIGHTKQHGGARSARGVMEFDFNRKIVEAVDGQLKESPLVKPVIVNPDGASILIADRTKAAVEQGAELFLSIHHDSVQSKYLSGWKVNGHKEYYCDLFKGFSIFYSSKNVLAEQSLLFAQLLGDEMRKREFKPTFHHAEKIRGEGRQLVDPERGIYEYGDLIVLKTAKMPAALIECGVIVNRNEEEQLEQESTRYRIATAISSAMVDYFQPRQVNDNERQGDSAPGLRFHNRIFPVGVSGPKPHAQHKQPASAWPEP